MDPHSQSEYNGASPGIDYRKVAHEILELAGQGYPRRNFLNDVSRLLLSMSDADLLRLAVCDSGRCFFCQSDAAFPLPFQFDEVSLNGDEKWPRVWSQDENGPIETICRRIIGRETSQDSISFTTYGTFWSDDLATLNIVLTPLAEDVRHPRINFHKEFESICLIPVDVGPERIGLLLLESRKKGLFTPVRIESLEYVAHTIGIALTYRRLQVAGRERVKELACLYGIARLTQRGELSLENTLREVVGLIPEACLYPQIATAQIVLGNKAFAAPRFDRAIQSISADIVVRGNKAGHIEVGYTETRPPLDDGPFMREERKLFDTIAYEISAMIEQKTVEQEKWKLQDQLRHADRLATIGQLAATVAHEVNEPLANILGYAQLIAKEPSIPARTAGDANKIVKSALHAREVIRGLLTFARKAAPAPELLNLNSVINDGLYFLESRCNKSGIRLICNLNNNIPEIRVDRFQVLQILTNLVVNAIQALPQGGQLEINTGFENDYITLEVKDNGIGMTEEVMKNIFDPFFTTKGVGEGTGLGLAVVRGIVTSLNGTIDVSSKPGQGTSFLVRFPAKTPFGYNRGGAGDK